MATQIQKKFIATAAVDETKILLSNTGVLVGRNAANNANVGIVQVDASDRVVFSSVPQSPSDAVASNDVVRFSQLATLVEGLKPKQAVAVASTANVDLTVVADPSPMDGYTILDGDRVLLKDQASTPENGIYVATTAVDPTTWVRSADFDVPSEIPGAYTVAENGVISQGILYVTTSAPAVIGTDPIVFTYRPDAAPLTAGDMIAISGGKISVNLFSNSGLRSTNPGSSGKLLVQVESTNPTLQIIANELGAKLKPLGALVSSSTGLLVNLELTNPTLNISGSNQLGVKLDASSALAASSTGITLQINSSSLKIVSNILRAFQPVAQQITLSGTDITNQYVDLTGVSIAAINISSVWLAVAGGPLQIYGTDYSIILGPASVSRVVFQGDLATGGAAALVAGDILFMGYSYF